jgi:two-component system, chemotaxis family, protein-glutamate methylesterase/glutaminase
METKPKGPVRVVVIDDSATERLFMVSLIADTQGMEVVGTGGNGVDAINLSKTLRPDIIVMDVIMPNVNGLEATAHIMHEHPTPIILTSSSHNPSEMNLSFEAQRAGALSSVGKPVMGNPEVCETFLRTIRLMAQVPLVRRWSKPQTRIPATTGTLLTGEVSPDLVTFTREQYKQIRIVGIASSTGGPSALMNVLQSLTGQFPVPILIVQHVSNGFAAGLAEWMDSQLTIKVQLAEDNQTPKPGCVYIAPDDFHMEMNANGTIKLHKKMAFRGLRPSANYLFESFSQYYGKQALAIILTGMGDDGAGGMQSLYRSGGLTIAQDRQSCVVYGMPKEAISLGAVDIVLNPSQINYALLQLIAAQDHLADGKTEKPEWKGK